jgi:hypothetical protein
MCAKVTPHLALTLMGHPLRQFCGAPHSGQNLTPASMGAATSGTKVISLLERRAAFRLKSSFGAQITVIVGEFNELGHIGSPVSYVGRPGTVPRF